MDAFFIGYNYSEFNLGYFQRFTKKELATIWGPILRMG